MYHAVMVSGSEESYDFELSQNKSFSLVKHQKGRQTIHQQRLNSGLNLKGSVQIIEAGHP